MSAKTKIVVLKMRELIYTAIFVGLGIVLILFFVFMFLPKDGAVIPEDAPTYHRYTAGVYTASLTLNKETVNVEVMVDQDHINAVRLLNLDETVSAMYPLFEPAMESLSTQLISSQSTDMLTYHEEYKYTSQVLIEAIKLALSKAEIN